MCAKQMLCKSCPFRGSGGMPLWAGREELHTVPNRSFAIKIKDT